VQKAAAHALISIAPFLPRVLRKSAAEQLVLVLLYDAKTSTRRKAFLALNAWSWTSQPKWHANVLEACGQHQQSLLDGLSPSVRELGLLVHSHPILITCLWTDCGHVCMCCERAIRLAPVISRDGSCCCMSWPTVPSHL
jgi:hypothetical protein